MRIQRNSQSQCDRWQYSPMSHVSAAHRLCSGRNTWAGLTSMLWMLRAYWFAYCKRGCTQAAKTLLALQVAIVLVIIFSILLYVTTIVSPCRFFSQD